MTAQISAAQLKSALQAQGGSARFTALAQALALGSKSEKRQLTRLLEQGAEEGWLQLEGKDWQLTRAPEQKLIARYCRRARGPDQLLPLDDSAALMASRDLRPAPHGATVAVVATDAEGLVTELKVLQSPGDTVLAGRVDKRGAGTLLRPESAVHSQPLALLGAEDLAHGQYVLARREGEGARVTESLGEQPSAALRIASVIEEFMLPTAFEAEVQREADALSGPAELLPRIDLRDQPFVTIDGADARDFDDAVMARPRQGGFTLWVAIADVSAHVAPASSIDREARERATSVYFPGRVLPMLPARLADDLCSLRPEQDRAVLVCEMQIGRSGKTSASRFYPALIRSQARLIYGDVAQALESGDFPAAWNPAVRKNVQALSQLYSVFEQHREQRGALDFRSRELLVELDEAGEVAGVGIPPRTRAHRLIEECMIAANVAAAKALRECEQPFLARIHESPDSRKLQLLRDYLAARGMVLAGGDQPEPAHVQAVLAAAEDRPDVAAVQLAVLQSMQAAVYAPSRAGHFGLALEDYAHFTSPIRRYPDLLVHRALYAMLGARPAPVAEDWAALGRHCSERERRADQAGWAVTEALKLDFVRDKVGQTCQGTITGVTDFGLFVELAEFGLSGLVHISELGGDYFVHDADRRRLRGRRSGQLFELGQALNVTIAAVDAASRKLDLVPAPATDLPSDGAAR